MRITFVDISERVRTETELSKLNSALERRTDKLKQLTIKLSNAEDEERRRIAIILHDDLQQYLAAVSFRLQILSACSNDDARNESLGLIKNLVYESIKKCRSLTHELSPPVLHQNGLLAALNWLAGDMEAKHGFKIVLESEPEAEPNSPELASFLFCSVRELVFNAMKHSGIDTAIVEAQSKGSWIQISVKDKGKGFLPDKIRQKYGFFSGLGLPTIEERITFIGGAFEIESAPGKGCSITLHIPNERQAGGQRKDIPSESVEKTADSTSTSSNKIRILLADDHAVMRDGLANLLEDEEYVEIVGLASDGVEVVRLAEELNPDLILMDISMPNMDGIEATARIRADHPDIRIVGLSMHDDNGSRERIIRAGASAFVTKSAGPDRLVKTIRELFNF